MLNQPSPELLKALSHPTRLAILRRLMAGPATLSTLGAQFGETPAHIRHHLQILRELGLVEADPTAPRRSHLEKYYRTTSAALLLTVSVLPEPPAGQSALVIGSKDIAARTLNQALEQAGAGLAVQIVPLNSLDGLIALRQGACQMATSHLLDSATGEYNRSFVRHLFPGQAMALIRLYQREEGLIVAPGNPLGLRRLEDLARPGMRMANREPGSGVRVWLDAQLKALGLAPENLHGYDRVAHSHEALARLIHQGQADVGVGLAASARGIGLGFIPLFEEPYDLVLPAAHLHDPAWAPFLEHLNSGRYRVSLAPLDGYHVPSWAGTPDLVE